MQSLAFSVDGARLLCGGLGQVHAFDVSRPAEAVSVRGASRKRRRGQRGVVSTMSFNPDGSRVYACGSFDSTTRLYDDRSGELVVELVGHRGGVTHVSFAPNGRLLATGARKDDTLLVWDLRCAGSAAGEESVGLLHRLPRPCATNQRCTFGFDCSSSLLLSGTSVRYCRVLESWPSS